MDIFHILEVIGGLTMTGQGTKGTRCPIREIFNPPSGDEYTLEYANTENYEEPKNDRMPFWVHGHFS